MNRTGYCILLGAAIVAGCTQATPEQQVVNDAATALGGRDRIVAVKTIGGGRHAVQPRAGRYP